jgi:DNA methylase
MASGEMPDREFVGFLASVIRNARAHVSANALHFYFMDWRHLGHLGQAAMLNVLVQINLCVWVKSNGGMGSLYRSQHELVPVFAERGARHANNVQLGKYGRNRSNVWNYPGANSLRGETREALADHPTPKPVRLIADAILDVTGPNDIVLDMFLGDGSTLIACERTNRLCYGIEIDPRYVDASIRRWEAETGRKAVHAETGKSFEEMREFRSAHLSKQIEYRGSDQ